MPATAPKPRKTAPVRDVTADLTANQRILLAAYDLEGRGQSPFTCEALIVVVWKASPRTFGLRGFANDYPDSNRVQTYLMGDRGLCRRGWLTKVSKKLYTLSRQGREEALLALQGGDSKAPGRRALGEIRLGEEEARRLDKLRGHPAFVRYLDDFSVKPTREQIAGFFDLKPAHTLEAARRCVVNGVVEFGGGGLTEDQLDKLEACGVELERRFTGRGVGAGNGKTT